MVTVNRRTRARVAEAVRSILVNNVGIFEGGVVRAAL